MFNPTDIAIEGFVARLVHAYRQTYSNLKPEIPGIVEWVGRMSLERIADSDALYHDLNHTMQVTLVGQKIIEGKHVREGNVKPEDWLCGVLALLCRSIGYVRGICTDDTDFEYVIDEKGTTMELPAGSSDASLSGYHVARAKIFVRERFSKAGMFDVEQICANIERTRFPIPDDPAYAPTDDFPGLVRAADLIGQLADPHYMRKLNALYLEFEENGRKDSLGYQTLSEMVDSYPQFFWNTVRPYIMDGLRYLQITQEGKQYIANLYSHVFAAEHHMHQLGPQRTPTPSE